jgi:hypothetical protein
MSKQKNVQNYVRSIHNSVTIWKLEQLTVGEIKSHSRIWQNFVVNIRPLIPDRGSAANKGAVKDVRDAAEFNQHPFVVF